MALRKLVLKTIIGLMFFCNPITYGTIYASEAISPLQPGATTGNAAGLLPPDGWYFSADFDYETGYVKNGSGDTAITPGGQKIKASNSAEVASLLWVPGWEILGARYAMAIAQPYKFQRTTLSGNGNTSAVNSNSRVNTSLIPVLLSWDLGGGFHLGSGLAIDLPDGRFDYSYDADTGRNTKASTSIGNHYWTFEPNIALTYLHDDWAFTLNNILDINTTNHTTDYETGKIYYLDATATKNIGKFTVGVIGNYIQQLSDDKINGQSVAAVDGFYSEGNKIQHVSLGPLLGYNFGPFAVTARALFPLHTENDCACSFFHVGFTVPF
jgi:hypothetical protein